MKIQIKETTIPIISPAVVVSVGEWDEANLITLAWVARVVSDPPIISISIRPSRYSYSLIEKLDEFVVNVPTSDQIREIDFCGTRTGKKVNKWKTLNLTKQKGAEVKVPLIKEFSINVECKVVKKIKCGTHMIYLGEVVAVHIDKEKLIDKKLDPLKQDQIAYIAQNYYGLTKNPLKKQGYSVKS